jgi:ABC-type transport system substrate-binding protein
MIRKSFLLSVVSLVCGFLAYTTCAPEVTQPQTSTRAGVPQTPRRGGTLRLAAGDPHSLDPVTIYDWLEGILSSMIYRPLLDYDQDERIMPMLAESLPQVSADGLTYTFALRQGVHFSNGREVVADDWVYSLERHLDPRNNSSFVNYYTNIAGAPAFKDARAKEQTAGAASPSSARSIEPKSVSGLRAIDRYTLEICLEKPDFIFSDVLATPMSAVVPREEVERLGNAFATHPVGTGPFVLGKWVRGVEIIMDRNPNYFRPGEPYLDHVDIAIGPDSATEIMMFERGELDYVPRVSTPDYLRLKRGPTLSQCMYGIEGYDVIFVSLNCEMPPFTDKRVRQAMNYALNKEHILKLLLNRGVVAHGLLMPANKGFNAQRAPYPYDPDKARVLLAQAGYAHGFETQLTVASDVEAWMKAALAVQQDLAAVGVKVELRKVQGPSSYVVQRRKTVPMAFGNWVPNFSDPKDTLDFLVNGDRITEDNCINTAFYSNAEVNQLFHQGAAEPDPAKRLQIYQRIEEHVFDDAPYLFLVLLNGDELHQPWLKGIKPRALWPRRLENAWIDR